MAITIEIGQARTDDINGGEEAILPHQGPSLFKVYLVHRSLFVSSFYGYLPPAFQLLYAWHVFPNIIMLSFVSLPLNHSLNHEIG